MTTGTEALDALFKSFNAAIKRSLVYSPSHPMCAEARAELFAHTREYLDQNEVLRFGITRDSIIIEGTEYDMAAGSFFLALAAHLHDRQLTSVTVYKPVTETEMGAFLDSMTLDIKELRRRGGIENIIDGEDIKNITIKRLEIEAGEETGELQFDDVDEEMVATEEIFIQLDDSSISDSERDKIILRIRKSPMETAKLLVRLSDLAATTEGDPSLEGRAAYLSNAIEKLSTLAANTGGDVKDEVFKNIAQGLTSLSDDFRSPILDMLNERFGDLDFGAELMGALNQALKAAGEETVGFFESGAPATELEEGAEAIQLNPQEVYFEFAHFYDEMPAQVEQSVEEEIASIEIEDVELQALETLMEILMDSEDEPRLTKTLSSIATSVNDLLLEGRLELAAKSIKAMRVKAKNLQSTSPELVYLLRETLLKIAEADNLTIILKAALESEDASDKRCGRAMLDMLGAGAIPGLLVLASREPAGERKTRLCKIAAHAGRGTLAIFERRLAEVNDSIASAVVLSLAQIDHPKATEILKKAMQHESETIRAEAIHAIASARDVDVASLITVMLDNVSEKVRVAAFYEIRKLKAESAIKKLVEIAEGKNRVNKALEFRVKAIQTMADINSEQAITALERIAGKRFAWSKKAKMLKIEAGQALQRMRAKQEE